MAVYPGQLNSGRSDAGPEMAMPALDIRGSHVYPLLKIFRRITIGPAEDLSAFYAKVSAALDAQLAKEGVERRYFVYCRRGRPRTAMPSQVIPGVDPAGVSVVPFES